VPEAEEEVRSLVRQLLQAVQTRDRVLLDRLLRPDYAYITEEGQRFTREESMGALDHQTAFELMELEPINVIVHGDEAKANYVATGEGTVGGRHVRGMFRIKQKMIRTNGKWQIFETRTKVIAPLY
jgi:hypothetical protein